MTSQGLQSIAHLLVPPPPVEMSYTRLGTSGLKVSKIILGTMSYGSKTWAEWVLEEDEALPLLEHAYQVGINTWDTSGLYSDGRSEEIIGKALTTYNIPRPNVVLMTKVRFGTSLPGEPALDMWASAINDGRMVNRVGLSRKHIFDAVENSMKRLGTYIDVLQIHRMDPDVPHEEIMRALNDVVERGWARYIGASSMPAWEFQMLQNVAEKHGWHKFISMQNFHNLLYREEEREMIPYCKATGVGLIPWSPIARGILCRPWNSDSAPSLREETDPSLSRLLPKGDVVNEKIVGVVEDIAKARGLPMAAIAIAWCLHKGVNPILGLNSKARIDEAVKAVKVTLTEEEIAKLEAPYVPKNVVGH
ncbi:Aldo/keto reductase [Massarina eburnea CBS 473.64]|uniref:Aldo/keto reductase n=1 Tax=Massarina eburnea CBS 473.64 TaxID=1395130 RepID=A0A6A6SGN9_9PLEO|nr:Aldo/keto reductase [Massarina eburnea CBS 473.64]